MGTLTPSDYSSAHTSTFTNIRYTSGAMATLKHLELFRPINYIHIVAFLLNPLKAFVYGETISILYSAIIKSLPLSIYVQRSHPSPRTLVR